MENLDLVEDDLKVDILSYLKIRERQLPVYKRDSPQIHRRRYMVDWVCLVCGNLNLTNRTIHLSVKILDYFMVDHDIAEEQLHFVGIGCILIAAKYEEKDSMVPRLPIVRQYLTGFYDKETFLHLELMIFDHFSFNISLPTASLFCEILLPYSLHYTDIMSGLPIVNFDIVQDKFRDFVKYFLDISLQNIELVGERSSAVASSALFCSRHVLSLLPRWPKPLQVLTGFRHSDQFWSISRQLLDVFNGQVSEPLVVAESSPHSTPPQRKKMRTSYIVSPDDGYSSGFSASSPEDHRDQEDQQEEIVILYDSDANYWITEATTSASVRNHNSHNNR